MQRTFHTINTFNIRVIFIAYLIVAFNAIQFSTVHIHPESSHNNETATHRLEVHLYNAEVQSTDVTVASKHQHEEPSIELEYDSALQKILKHLFAHSSLHSWYAAFTLTETFFSRRWVDFAEHNNQNYIPYLRSQAPPVLS